MRLGIFSIILVTEDEFTDLLTLSKAHFIGTGNKFGIFLPIILLSTNIFPLDGSRWCLGFYRLSLVK